MGACEPAAYSASAMRVLIVSQSAQDLEGAGGRTRILSELASSLRAQHACALLCFVPFARWLRLPSLLRARARLAHDAGCPVWYVPRVPTWRVHFLKRLAALVEASVLRLGLRVGRFDVCHAHTTSAACLAVRARGTRSAVRVLADIHGSSEAEYAHARGAHADPREVRRLEAHARKAVLESDVCVFVSEAMRKHYADRFGRRSGPAFVIPCATAITAPRAEVREARRRELGIDDRIVLLYLGSWRPYQCAEAMIDMVRRVRACSDRVYLLVLTGHAEAFRRALDQAGIQDGDASVHSVAHADVPRWVVAADAGFLLREAHLLNAVSSPTKFAEYLACGVPVLITPGVGDYSDVVASAEVGAVIGLDASGAEILTAVERVVAQREAHARRCKAVASSLSWAQQAPVLEAAYDALETSARSARMRSARPERPR